jgi:GNAT superfamily N-acetyltransferase
LGDPERIRYLTQATGFFADAEIRVAEELAQERLSKGTSSGYHFVMVEQDDSLIGYTCYGPIACTLFSFDIYWIAVQPERQGAGLGRRLIEETERRIRKSGGTRIYVETSQRPKYDVTRTFYKNMDYRLVAVIPDFYAPGDGKAIFCKVLT